MPKVQGERGKNKSKLKELEERIEKLEKGQFTHISYINVPPTITTLQAQQFQPCPVCGRNYPHVCVTC